jgi:hypothetical protein
LKEYLPLLIRRDVGEGSSFKLRPQQILLLLELFLPSQDLLFSLSLLCRSFILNLLLWGGVLLDSYLFFFLLLQGRGFCVCLDRLTLARALFLYLLYFFLCRGLWRFLEGAKSLQLL